jgi:hypothetical protein
MIKLTHAPGSMVPISGPTGVLPWRPQKIAYLKVLRSGTWPYFVYSYDPNLSGYYNQNLTGFLQTILAGPPSNRFKQINFLGGLDFELGYSAYVIFQLDPALDWQYRYDADGIGTTDTTPNEYVSLTHVDDGGNTIPGGGLTVDPNAQAPSTQVHIAYFMAKAGSANGTSMTPTTDGFNLYVTRPATGDDTIDPDIKNTGHPPPLISASTKPKGEPAAVT